MDDKKLTLVLPLEALPIAATSDASIWNLADIPITDNGSELSADTNTRSDIQLC